MLTILQFVLTLALLTFSICEFHDANILVTLLTGLGNL
jgi:hypothetical protein